jgi:repressor of nif and glnA expression
MRRIALLAILAVSVFSFTGCGAMIAMGGGGLFYQDTKAPSAAVAYYGSTTNSMGKIGKASVTSILGIIVTGDASLDAAMRAGSMTKLHHVDTQATNILGIIATYTTIAYGE